MRMERGVSVGAWRGPAPTRRRVRPLRAAGVCATGVLCWALEITRASAAFAWSAEGVARERVYTRI